MRPGNWWRLDGKSKEQISLGETKRFVFAVLACSAKGKEILLSLPSVPDSKFVRLTVNVD